MFCNQCVCFKYGVMIYCSGAGGGGGYHIDGGDENDCGYGDSIGDNFGNGINYSIVSCTAGAMRLPGEGKEGEILEKHYLTNLYAQSVFGLETIPFANATDNGFYYLYGKRYSTAGKSFAIQITSFITRI